LFTVIVAFVGPTLRYDTIEEFNVDSKADYSALSSTRSQKKKLKQTTPVLLWYIRGPQSTSTKAVRKG